MRMSPLASAVLGAMVGTTFSLSAGNAAIVQHQITSDAGDGEVRQSSASATFGAYTTAQGAPTTHLRVGFQSSFGSEGQTAGGLNAIWFFKLPKLDLAGGEMILDADFVTTLLDESATAHITPRFNADLYALGFVTSPTIGLNDTFFYAGQNQSGQTGLGAGQTIQRLDDDYFTVFTDWQEVNTVSPKKPKPIFTDASGKLNLADYIQGIYENPAFPNTGQEYLVLRLNPDRAPNETYEENGTQFFGKGTSRYRVADSESATLVSTASIDYSEVIPTRLSLTVQVPEPATFAFLGLGVALLGTRRRRTT